MYTENESDKESYKTRISSLVITIMAILGLVYLGILARFVGRADRFTMTSCVVILIVMLMLFFLAMCYSTGTFEEELIRNQIYIWLLMGVYVTSFLNGCVNLLEGDGKYAELIILGNTAALLVDFSVIVRYCLYLHTFISLPESLGKYIVFIRRILTIIYVGLLIVNLFTGFLFELNEAFRIECRIGYTVFAGINLVLAGGYAVLVYREIKGSVLKWTLLTFNLAYIVGTPMEFFVAVNGVENHFGWFYCFMAFISLFLIFCNVYVEHSRRLLRQENELTASKLNAMIMQIDPHFIYNTLASIDSLVRTQPEEAHQLIMKFSSYLRDNYAAMTSQPMVSFRDELKILEHYLAIEQVRFPNLKVVYRIQAVNFKIPGLTVQPLAENAVKHGIRKRKRGEGTLTIESEERPDDYVVRIIDDGVGFETIPEDGKPHIGIGNARKRLEILCGGTLNITSIPQTGTVCEIIIPKTFVQDEKEAYYEGTLRG